VLSKKVGRPVKVMWTREDDIKFDYFNAVAGMYFKTAVDAKGKTDSVGAEIGFFPPITFHFLTVNAVLRRPAASGAGLD